MDKRMLTVMFLLITVFVGFGLIIPVMPVLVKSVAPEFHLGMMLAAYSAVSFVASPMWGALSDRIGRRPVILVGLIGFAISFLVFAFALESLFWMYMSRLLGGLFSGAATACAMAYVADITSEEERTKGMALAGMSIGLGFIMGPALGGLLSVLGKSVPFLGAAALSLVAFLFAFFFLQESLAPEKRGKTTRQNRWQAFAGPLKYLYLVAFVGTYGLAGLEATLQYYQMVKIEATPLQIGMMLGLSGIVGAAVQGGFVRRVPPGKEVAVTMAGLAISAAGMVLILFSSNFWNATLFVVIFGVGNTLIRPCITSLVTKHSEFSYGISTGLISSMDSLGRIAGPLLATLFYSWQISLPFLVTAVISLLSIGLLAAYLKQMRTLPKAA